jgi:hypothetical protein
MIQFSSRVLVTINASGASLVIQRLPEEEEMLVQFQTEVRPLSPNGRDRGLKIPPVSVQI